jgi:large subunit ribosomal protein L10
LEGATNMPTEAKAQTIQATKERFQRSRGVLFAEYRGLKVVELQQLRKDLGQNGDFQVVKNTLFRIAAGDAAAELPEAMTSGPTAVTFVYENESDCAKALTDYAKAHPHLVIKGAYLDGAVMDAKQVDALAKLPPREVLIAQLVGTIAAPLSNLVGVVEALYADPIRVIGAVADKVGEGAPAPAPTAAQAPAAEAEAPAAEAPAAEAEAPAAEAEAPAAEAEAPAAEAEAPAADAEAPLAEAPAAEAGAPTPAEDAPAEPEA